MIELLQKIEENLNMKNDLCIPIAHFKGIRKYKEKPRYPITLYISLKHISPHYINEALQDGNWRKTMTIELQVLEKESYVGDNIPAYW